MAKNAKTVWREAQVRVGDGALVIDVADPIDVIEQAMRYFYAMGVQGVKAKAPVEEVGKYFKMAMQAASMAAPYRHPRLSAVKHTDGLGQPGSIDGIRADATPEELRAEIAKRVAMLRDKGYVDLDALPAPGGSPQGGVDDAEENALTDDDKPS